MPYPNQHAFRVMDPGKFQENSFRRKEIEKGLFIIIGKLKNDDKMSTQAYRFNLDNWTFSDAEKWIKDHDIKPILSERATKSRIQSFLSLQSKKIQSFNIDEIINIIGIDKFNEIKLKDNHPFFQMYSICHEGISYPRIIGDEKPRPIAWTRKAVQSIKNVIKSGIKFFKGHNADNSTDNSRILGEVIGSAEKEINGKLHHIVVSYHKPEVVNEVKNYDICSQEAEWNFIEKSGKLIADTIENITGIALGNSQHEQPAFSKAVRIGMMQAFNEKEKTAGEPAEKIQERKMPTFEEIKQAIVQMNIHPSQLYSLERIKADHVFMKDFEIVENEIKNLKNQTETLLKEKTEKENTLAEMIKKEQTATVKSRLSEMVKQINTTDKERLFIEKMFNDKIEPTEEGLKSFIDNQRAVYREVLQLAGVTETPINFKSGDNEKQNDYSNPETNDFLSTGE